MDPVTIADLLAATGGQLAAGWSAESTFDRVVVDSRLVTSGDVFWALPGEQQDGHDFVRDACLRGAAFCVVNENYNGWSGPVVRVPHTGAALLQFARWYREQLEPLVIGVTGSVGKTTTREMIHAALSGEHRGIRSLANYNNEIGLPLSLFPLSEEHDYGVFEMGACRPGDIRALCAVAQPEVGVITGIAPAHMAKFGSIEEIVRTKAELLQALPNHGFAVVNGDCPHAQAVAAHADCPVVLVGEGPHNDLCGSDIFAGQSELRFCAAGHEFRIPASGRHYLTAALAAVAVGLEVGMSPARIAEGLREFKTPEGRCQIKQIGPWTIIDDSYNANPASMRAACQLMTAWQTGHKKIVIVGDMLELGDEATRYHHELGAQFAGAGIDCLLAHGDNARDVIAGAYAAGMEVHRLAECSQFESLLTNLECWLEPGDVLLVKGSRSTRMERVIDWTKKQSDAATAWAVPAPA